MPKIHYSMKKFLLLGIIVLCFSISQALAGIQLYFNNQPLQRVKILDKNSTLYLPLKDLSLKLNFALEVSGNRVAINQQILSNYFTQGGEIWAAVPEVCRAINAWSEYNQESGVLDLYTFSPQAQTEPTIRPTPSPCPEPVESVDPVSTLNKTKTPAPNEKEQPLKVEKSDIFYPNDDAIKCEARVRNTGDHAVSNGVITCIFNTMRGDLIGKVAKPVPYLSAGQSDLMAFQINVNDFVQNRLISSGGGDHPGSSQGSIFPVLCDFKITYK